MKIDNTHPLEDLFNLEPGSTPSPFKFEDSLVPPSRLSIENSASIVDPATGELISRTSDGASDLEKEERIEDLHIDAHLDNIRGAAHGAFEAQLRLSQEVDPKFSARNAEVAAQYLNIALNAVNSKINAKFKRQKIRIEKNASLVPNTVNNNVILADRNQLLQEIMQKALAIDLK